MTQLTLSVQLRDDATFINFSSGENHELIHYLQHFLLSKENFIYLWGNQGSGKTHLLQACCHQANEKAFSAFYLSLAQTSKLSPDILEDIETLSLVCFDDLDAIAGNHLWEEALFHCYNRLRQANVHLIIASQVAPKLLPLQLPDLKSRLSAGIIFQLQSLTDEQKLSALQLRAKIRGMKLTKNVAQFLLNHYPRDTKALFDGLEKLDQASLIAKQKLTIPFVKKALANLRQ